ALGRYVVTLPSKLLLSPLIDGIGQGAWHNMLRRTQMLFYREEAFDIRDFRDNSPKIRKMLTQGPDGGAYSLFRALRDLLQANPHTLEMTIIGHSMGTIVLNRVLREFPDLPVRNIVYMAAACSIDDFRTSVIPYLLRSENQEARFYNLMLHPDAEVREWQKSFLDLTPRGSLLVWIDNFLSAPQTTLDRTLGSWENIIQATHIIPLDVRPRITLKAFCIGGPTCKAPATHGAFSDKAFRFWRPEFWQIPESTDSRETIRSLNK
ncbi:MAG: alpha/beta hydrolase, partial [Nitrospirota bacterium]|nr:alpha/beta hydrolase [Nitrospirota bacterium]